MTSSHARKALIGLLTCALLAASAGCRQGRYQRALRAVRGSGLLEPDADHFSITLLDKRDGSPVADTQVTLVLGSRTWELTTSSAGVLRLPITPELEDGNPRVRIDHDGPLIARFTWTAKFGSENTATAVLSTDGMPAIDGKRCRVYYEPGTDGHARKAADQAERQWRLVTETTGLEPVEWAVFVFAEKDEDTNYIVPRAEDGLQVWAYCRAEIDSGHFARFNAHEWTEQTLVRRLALGDADSRNRFISDGLAEYVAFLSGGMEEGYESQLAKLRERGVEDVDLLKRFRHVSGRGPVGPERLAEILEEQGYPAGYALSFVFWYQLCEEHSPEFPATFLGKLAEQPKRNSKAAIRLIEEITGRDDIRRRLRRANVAEAIGVIEKLKAAQEAGPGSGRE